MNNNIDLEGRSAMYRPENSTDSEMSDAEEEEAKPQLLEIFNPSKILEIISTDGHR